MYMNINQTKQEKTQASTTGKQLTELFTNNKQKSLTYETMPPLNSLLQSKVSEGGVGGG